MKNPHAELELEERKQGGNPETSGVRVTLLCEPGANYEQIIILAHV